MSDLAAIVEDFAANKPALPRSDAATWAVLLGAATAYEFWQISRRDEGVPLSRIIRTGFHTDTRVGAAAFQLTLEVGATWLIRHILNTARKSSS